VIEIGLFAITQICGGPLHYAVDIQSQIMQVLPFLNACPQDLALAWPVSWLGRI